MISGFLRPEEQLLLQCARTKVESSQIAFIKDLLNLPLNWDYFLQVSVLQKVLPLVHHFLNQIPNIFPEAVLSKTRVAFEANVQRNLFLTVHLRRLIQLLEANHIPAVPYKGLTLGAIAYKSLFLRTLSDLDVFVPEEAVDQVITLLVRNGYQPSDKEPTSRQAILRYRRYSYHHALIHSEDEVSVEIHWRFLRDPHLLSVKAFDFWKGLVQVVLSGKAFHSFSPEVLLLLLCGHGAKHFWLDLMNVCDVAELLRSHPHLDWEWVLQTARDLNIRRLLWLGILVAVDLLQAPAPMWVIELAQSDPIASAVGTKISQNFFTRINDARFVGKVAIPIELSLRERWQDKWSYVVRHVFLYPPNDEDQAVTKLPRFFLPFVRPFRLMMTYAPQVLQSKKWIAESPGGDGSNHDR